MSAREAASTECRVAIVGAGSMAREHVRAFKDVAGVCIAGIHSRSRDRADALASAFGIPAVCASVPELFERTESDLVVVAVSEAAMSDVAHTCLEFPSTLLLEKPPGYDLAQATAIQRTASAKNRRVLVGLNRRFYSSTGAALNDLESDQSPRYIHVQDQQSLEDAAALGLSDAVVQKWMYVNSIHVVDYLTVFGRGRVRSISPIFPWRPAGPAGVVAAAVEFEGGDTGFYEGLWNGPGPWAVSVTTAAKRWEMRPLEQASVQLRGERERRPAETSQWDRDFKPGFRSQAAEAVAAATGHASRSVSLDEAVETMRLVAGIFGHV